MKKAEIKIDHIPAVIYGKESDKVYLYVHGKMASKEVAETFAKIAEAKGYQTIAFDLPKHGERINEDELCNLFTGMADLKKIADYTFKNWDEVYLFANSLGAHFSLNTYNTYDFKKCLFQSPIVNMPYLVEQMMQWFDISYERLETEKEIMTPVDLLTFKEYDYIHHHPIEIWPFPTSILYGELDNLQSLEVMKAFSERFKAKLTVAKNCEHAFLKVEEIEVFKDWLEKEI